MAFWQRLNAPYHERTRGLRGGFWQRQTERLQSNYHFYQDLLDGLYHGFIVGPSGMGKSKLIEALVRFLKQRKDRPTIFLLDPGGATAKQVELWALREGLADETVILDPEESRFYLGYNPLAETPGLPISLQAKFLQEAIYTALRIDQKAKDSIYYAPMVKQCLYFLAHILMETKLTFEEASYLLASRPNKTAGAIIERAETAKVRDFWLDLQRLKPGQRQQTLGLLQAELLSFITSDPIKRMMGQRERMIIFPDFIESGKLFIANLEAGSTLTSMDAKLLTNLLISSIVRACFARPAYTGKEVFLILEEAGEIEFSSDIGTILRRARKQGLRTILLNQDICSMLEDSPKIFSMLWANANHRIAFGDLPFRDLEILAPEFYGEELNLKEVKDEIETVYFEPKESRRTIHTLSSIDSYADSEVEGTGDSFGEAEVFTEEGFILPFRETIHLAESKGSSQSRATGSSQSHAEISGETIVPFYEYLKRSQVTNREFWSLQEQFHKVMVKLKQLPKATIALKRRGKSVEILKVPHIPDLPWPENCEELRAWIFKSSGYYATLEEVEAEQTERAKRLESKEIIIE